MAAGTATSGADYAGFAPSVTIPAGASTMTFALSVLADGVAEPAEGVALCLKANAAYRLNPKLHAAAATITDASAGEPTVTIAASPATVAENGGVASVFTVTLTGAEGYAGPFVVPLAVSGTADEEDYDASSIPASVTFAPPAGGMFGASPVTQTFSVTPIDDAIAEPSETVAVAASEGAGYVVGAASSATVTITDDDDGVLISGLTAVANTSTWATLTWQTVSNATDYRVHRSTTPVMDDYYDDIADIDDSAATVYEDDNLQPGTTYYYDLYAFVNYYQSTVKVGEASITTPIPTEPTNSTGEDLTAAGIMPTFNLSNLQAVGVNDTEIMVSWDAPTSPTVDGFDVEISPNGTTWFPAGRAQAMATSYLVRGIGPKGENFLVQDIDYKVRVRTKYLAGHSAWVGPAIASTIRPNSDVDFGSDMIIVSGGNNQDIDSLLKGMKVGVGSQIISGATNIDSVGYIWAKLVNKGFNAYLTADPHDGGVPDGTLGMPHETQPNDLDARTYTFANDASGRIYDELFEETKRLTHENPFADRLDIGLVGYSHGGGMIYNLSQKILNDGLYANVVFSATIDAVQYDPLKDQAGGVGGAKGFWNQQGLLSSPLSGWPNAEGHNWWESVGFKFKNIFPGSGTLLPGEIHGLPFGASNIVDTRVFGTDHSRIATDTNILNEAVSDAERVFDQIFH